MTVLLEVNVAEENSKFGVAVGAALHLAEQIDTSQCVLVQPPHDEPWGQKTCRAIASGGGLIGFAVTPWARRLAQEVQAAQGNA